MFSFKSIHEFNQHFDSELSCYNFLEKLWWSDGIYCPHCGSIKQPYKVASRTKMKDAPTYRCSEKECQLPFTIKTGSIFDGTHIELMKWFHAIYEISINKKGISSLLLSEKINVSQKTAWLMIHKIRTKLFNDQPEMLDGIVEIDETFVGGKNKNRHKDKKVEKSRGRSFKDKTPVLGMINDEGKVRLFVVPDTSANSIVPILVRNIRPHSEVCTDEWGAYNSISHYFNHYVVDHGRKQYSNCGMTTNRIENFWGLFKRGLVGIYNSVSRKHLQRYCSEFEFRFNNRDKEQCERFLLTLDKFDKPPITYKKLTA